MKLKSLFSCAMIILTINGATALTIGCAKPATIQASLKGEENGSENSDSKDRQIQQKSQAEVQAHADKLYASVKKAREQVRQMRIQAGLHPHAAGPHIDPNGHHANDTPEQRKRESAESENHEEGKREGRREREREGGHEGKRGDRGHREGGERGHREGGERGHREGGEKGESSGKRMARLAKHVKTYKNGAKLTLQFNPVTQAFIGNVTNTTKKDLPDVRVEIHLSNGVELGPTRRTNVKPGQTIAVELGAFGEKFTHWTTHPEAGIEGPHGPDAEKDEHIGGSREGKRGEEGREGGRGHAERERGEHRREGARGEGGRGHAERERGEHGGKSEGGKSHEGGLGGHGLGDASLRPVYNQIRLLRGEMNAFRNDLKAKKKDK